MIIETEKEALHRIIYIKERKKLTRTKMHKFQPTCCNNLKRKKKKSRNLNFIQLIHSKYPLTKYILCKGLQLIYLQVDI